MAQQDPLLMTCEDTRLNDGEAITLFLRTKHTIEGLVQGVGGKGFPGEMHLWGLWH